MDQIRRQAPGTKVLGFSANEQDATQTVRNYRLGVNMYRRLGSLLLSGFLMAGFILAVTTKVAHAYIDVGSASLMLQMLVATAIGSLFAIKVFWHRITGNISRFLSRVKSPREPVE